MSGSGANGSGRKKFSFHLPKAWSYVPAASSSSSSSSTYARLPSTGEPGNSAGTSAQDGGHDEEEEDDDENERLPRPSLSMTSSYMSETSMAFEDQTADSTATDDHGTNLGALERTAAWTTYTSFQRLAVSISFILLGAGVLLSFNALISPTEFFRSRFRGTPYENTFSSWIVSAYNVASILFGAHAVATLGSDRWSKKSNGKGGVNDRAEEGEEDEEAGLSARSRPSSAEKQLQIILRSVRRIFSSGVIVVFCLVILALSTGFKHPQPPKSTGSAQEVKIPSASYFYVVMALAIILAAAVAYLQNAVVAVCSSFGPRAMSLMLSGQGFIGLSISLVQLAAAWGQSDPAVQAQIAIALEQDPNFVDPPTAAARIFFWTGAGLMGLTLISFWLLIQSRCWSDVLEASMVASHSRRSSHASALAGATRTSSSSEAAGVDAVDRDGDADGETLNRPSRPRLASYHSITVIKATEESSFLRWISPHLSPETQSSLARLWDVQAQTIILCLTIAYIFVLTLALFPALTARVQSVGYTNGDSPARWQTPLVFSAIHFVAFNFADLVGRSLPGLLPTIFLVRSTALAALLTAGRTILLPLLRGCNLPRSPSSNIASATSSQHQEGGSILKTDTAFLLIMLTMGLSNGLLATSILIAGPSKVHAFGSGKMGNKTPSKSATRGAQALSATVLSYWLTLGLAVGSALSFVSVKWA
ncbi:hypothetical protein A4X09_0g3170 [Tilletia walkeri]|uniref:Uncharacterized protein n=1 Tax=Tilletia walkeri TaxID=117179 RepID=A0A8X7NB49_9BASI|nr:hypothetical protein A4X09_0g3170 [Tilletia walkeri]